MSRDRLIDNDLQLTPLQITAIATATREIRGARQRHFHEFVNDVLRGLREITDRDVHVAIRHGAERYGRPI